MNGRGRLYTSYAWRSLRRGGQRSLLAVFCIAVGVMAVVALRLAGDMVSLWLTSNLRGLIGGDLILQSSGTMIRARDTAIVSQFVADETGTSIGRTVHLTLLRGGGADVRVTGILHNSLFDTTSAYVSPATYAAISGRPLTYGRVVALAPGTSSAEQAAERLRGVFPAASVQTVQDALDENITISRQISRALQIIGLLALLLGGIGIVNTMQVSLSRRRVEIAMLKTAGYRRRDLYALFGLEAATLGLAGGLIGTALGVGISAVVRVLVERVFLISFVFHIGASTLLTGLVVGLATALIFGLLPIVRAAAIRPRRCCATSPSP